MYLVTLVFSVQLLASICTATTVTSNKTFTVSTWSNSWNFDGFAIGPSSGDYYNLLSSDGDDECAIVRETPDGNITWSKLYGRDTCAGLSIDSTEEYAYFVNRMESYFGVNQVLCSTGETNNYYTSTYLNSTGRIRIIDAKNNPGHVVLSGNLQEASTGNECVAYWDVSGTSHNHLCSADNNIYFGAIAIPDGFCTGSRLTANNQHSISCYNMTGSTSIWNSVFNFTDPFDAEVISYSLMTADANNLYGVLRPTADTGNFLVTLSIADGSYVDIIRKREITGLYYPTSIQAPGDSVVYVSTASSNGPDCELIKLNVSSTDYIIYRQSGLSFKFQFINTALNDCWYALLDRQYTHYTQLSSMSEVTSLSVTNLTNTGLTDVNNTNSSGLTGTGLAPFPSESFVTTTTNVAAAFNVSITVVPEPTNNTTQNNTTSNSTTQTNTTQTSNNTTTTNNNTNENNSDDDSLSTLAVVLIIVGAAILIVVVIGTVLCVIKCRKSSRNRNPDLSKVEPPADETNVLKEENKI